MIDVTNFDNNKLLKREEGKKMINKLTDAEMNELARKARREYMREYRQRPEAKKKIAEYQKRYWAKKALETIERV